MPKLTDQERLARWLFDQGLLGVNHRFAWGSIDEKYRYAVRNLADLILACKHPHPKKRKEKS